MVDVANNARLYFTQGSIPEALHRLQEVKRTIEYLEHRLPEQERAQASVNVASINHCDSEETGDRRGGGTLTTQRGLASMSFSFPLSSVTEIRPNGSRMHKSQFKDNGERQDTTGQAGKQNVCPSLFFLPFATRTPGAQEDNRPSSFVLGWLFVSIDLFPSFFHIQTLLSCLCSLFFFHFILSFWWFNHVRRIFVFPSCSQWPLTLSLFFARIHYIQTALLWSHRVAPSRFDHPCKNRSTTRPRPRLNIVPFSHRPPWTSVFGTPAASAFL